MLCVYIYTYRYKPSTTERHKDRLRVRPPAAFSAKSTLLFPCISNKVLLRRSRKNQTKKCFFLRLPVASKEINKNQGKEKKTNDVFLCQFTPLHVRRNKITISLLQNPLYIGRMSKPQRSERNHGMRVLFFFNSLILPARREYKSVAAHRIIGPASLCIWKRKGMKREKEHSTHSTLFYLSLFFSSVASGYNAYPCVQEGKKNTDKNYY